jgi:uncharacterized membrane protein YdjX (TVP38/TMEM64 family)
VSHLSPNKSRLFQLTLLALLALVVVGVGLRWRVEVSGWIVSTMAVVRGAGPVVFFAAMALLPVAGFPIFPFNLAAGPAFSEQLGLGPVVELASAAIAINVSLTYWLARYALRPPFAWLVRRLGYRIPEVAPGNHLALAMLVRVTPGPPFFFQSCLLGLAAIPFGIYLAVSWVVTTAYAAATIVFGDALMQGHVKTALVALGLLGALAIGIKLLRQRLAKKAAP